MRRARIHTARLPGACIRNRSESIGRRAAAAERPRVGRRGLRRARALSSPDPRQEVDHLGLDLGVTGPNQLRLRVEDDIGADPGSDRPVASERLTKQPAAAIAFKRRPNLARYREPDAKAAAVAV